ncbi:hypothetical protein CDAR_373381 [Caerostris darwini]|uniref:Uncharacterized protein n=1 Tax=Caerostris darwini TaxID=1538125 RepID=A0AAV4N2N7_9ARAC|nr:hypothetical protein CDAR_373381 [Caerostris darwini]
MRFIPIRRVLNEFRFAIDEKPEIESVIAPIHFVPSPDSYSPLQWNGDEIRCLQKRVKSHLIYRIGKMRIDSLAILYSRHAQRIPLLDSRCIYMRPNLPYPFFSF